MTNRRQFLELMAAAAGTLGIGASVGTGVLAQTTSPKARVIVVGGGMAGSTAAKYLRMWGDQVEVTLVDRSATYNSCILSNLVVTGQRTPSFLQFGYSTLQSKYGVKFVKDDVLALDPVNKSVRLAGGATLKADRIIVAPGVEFDTIPGLESIEAQNRVPHAWKAGPQTLLLRDRLAALPARGKVILTIPKAPYRCPPGPYERACIIADYLKRYKPGAHITVLDANPNIMAEAATFTKAFSVTHAGVLEYRSGVEVVSIDAPTGMVYTNVGYFQADLVNAIPPHRGGKIIADSGLNNVGGRWAGVNVLTYESTAAPGIHVIGDSSATTQPKAGHIANQEAKVCADAISNLFAGRTVDPSPMTNSACFSTITMQTASWLTAVFAYDPASATMKVVPESFGEAGVGSQDNFDDMLKWFRSLMADSFA